MIGKNIVIGAGSLGGRISVKCAGDEVDGGVSGDAFHGNASTDVPPTVTPEDIARDWQLVEVRTNCNISYMMPEGAMLATAVGPVEPTAMRAMRCNCGDCLVGASMWWMTGQPRSSALNSTRLR